MTNFERWKLYMRDASSPEIYIDISFYYMIAAALQRRVWFSGDENSIFPNPYLILVGPAATGKGLCTGPVTSFLSHHKVMNPAQEAYEKAKKAGLNDDEIAVSEFKDAAKAPKREQCLFHVAPQSTTKESIVHEMAKATDIHFYRDSSGKLRPYMHQSLHFALDELGSLIQKNDEKTLIFLLSMYNCIEDYRHVTIGRGEDYIAKGCLALMAGVTDEGVQDMVEKKILTNGFLSRAWFVYGEKPRSQTFMIPKRDESQVKAKEELLVHIKGLHSQFGQLYFTPEAHAFLEQDFLKNAIEPTNKSPILATYYGRRQLHAIKLSMAVHFAENLGCNIVGIESATVASQLLTKIEVDMHKCFQSGGRNVLAGIANTIYKQMKTMPGWQMTERQIRANFAREIKDGKELTAVLELLIAQEKIQRHGLPTVGGSGQTYIAR